MARWQRDPKIRRLLTGLLAAAETLAVAINFYPICSSYAHQVNLRVRLYPTAWHEALALGLTALFLGVAIFQAVLYVKGRAWARWAFIGENALLVLMGLVWFLHNRLGGETPNALAALYGLALPLGTLFPLLWPLMAFKPVESAAPDAAAA